MQNRLKSVAGSRLRRILGVDGLSVRLDAIDRRLDALERSRYPHDPVYLGDHQALLVARWGAKLIVDTRDSLLAPWLLMDGLWEAHVTGWFHDVVKPGDTVVDVGANIGYFTVLAAQLTGPGGRVVGVEAHPGLFEFLRRNVIINGYRDRVRLWNRAAWSEPAQLQFRSRTNYLANSSLGAMNEADLSDLGDTEEVLEVEAAPLDVLLDGLDRVDVIKVDVEGAEVHAFRGLERTIASNPDITVLFEWSPEQLKQMGNRPEELVDVLSGYGFRFRLIERELAQVSRSDLIDLPYGNVVATRRSV